MTALCPPAHPLLRGKTLLPCESKWRGHKKPLGPEVVLLLFSDPKWLRLKPLGLENKSVIVSPGYLGVGKRDWVSFSSLSLALFAYEISWLSLGKPGKMIIASVKTHLTSVTSAQ